MHMAFEPVFEQLPTRRSGRDGEYGCLLLVGRGMDLEAVQDEEDLHRGVAYALVPVDERMTLDEREPQGGSLGNERRIELSAVKGSHRLRESRLNTPQVPDARSASRRCEEVLVQRKNLREREVSDHASRR